jgi:HEAT repeat protein
LFEDVFRLAAYADDDDPRVRSAAAGALRKVQSPEAEATLLDLAADSNPDVQGRALHTLAGYALTPAHLDALQREVVSGRLGQGVFAVLMTVLDRNRDQADAVLPVLDAMLDQDVANRRLFLRIRALREELSSEGVGSSL